MVDCSDSTVKVSLIPNQYPRSTYVFVLFSRPSYRLAFGLPQPEKVGETIEFLMVDGLFIEIELLLLRLMDRLTGAALVVLAGLLRSPNSLPPVDVPSFPSSSKTV